MYNVNVKRKIRVYYQAYEVYEKFMFKWRLKNADHGHQNKKDF